MVNTVVFWLGKKRKENAKMNARGKYYLLIKCYFIKSYKSPYWNKRLHFMR